MGTQQKINGFLYDLKPKINTAKTVRTRKMYRIIVSSRSDPSLNCVSMSRYDEKCRGKCIDLCHAICNDVTRYEPTVFAALRLDRLRFEF
jgi:hypothetical protein